MESFLGDLSIFGSENAGFLLVYLSYALVMGWVFSLIESRKTKDIVPYASLLVMALIMAAVASLMMMVNLYIAGWHSFLLGSEEATHIVLTVVSLVLLFVIKRFFVKRLFLPLTRGCLAMQAFVYLLPFIAFTVLLFMLAANNTGH